MINFWRKTPIIEFICHPNFEGVLPKPKPAAKCIPDWFKRIKPTLPNNLDNIGRPGLTAKKCMPLLDAMSVGFVIPLQADVGIRTSSTCAIIEAKNGPEVKSVEFHNVDQIGGTSAPGYPAPPIKFLNWWVVKTAPGWSTLFLPIINDLEQPHFTCLAGLVDTDTYVKEVNFPAIWHTADYNGILTAGTPLVVAIPIPREVLKISKEPIIRSMTNKEYKNIERIRIAQSTRPGVYTNELREERK
ncbi:MAG: hypothetical protein ACO3UU_11220 [Minisyncoccia bacterium]